MFVPDSGKIGNLIRDWQSRFVFPREVVYHSHMNYCFRTFPEPTKVSSRFRISKIEDLIKNGMSQASLQKHFCSSASCTHLSDGITLINLSNFSFLLSWSSNGAFSWLKGCIFAGGSLRALLIPSRPSWTWQQYTLLAGSAFTLQQRSERRKRWALILRGARASAPARGPLCITYMPGKEERLTWNRSSFGMLAGFILLNRSQRLLGPS